MLMLGVRERCTFLTLSIAMVVWHLSCLAEAGAPLLVRAAFGNRHRIVREHLATFLVGAQDRIPAASFPASFAPSWNATWRGSFLVRRFPPEARGSFSQRAKVSDKSYRKLRNGKRHGVVREGIHVGHSRVDTIGSTLSVTRSHATCIERTVMEVRGTGTFCTVPSCENGTAVEPIAIGTA